MDVTEVSKDVETAYQKALEGRNNSYSPYSNFKVGACIKTVTKTEQGHYFKGCNIENASYGGTICAERSAIHKLISEHGEQEIEFIVIVADTEDLTAPCGLCRQVMAEFFKPSTPVYLGNLEGVKKMWTFDQILPFPFNRQSLLNE